MNNLRWLTEQIYDLSLATHGIRPGTGGEPVAIIAMDGRSLASEELAATPRILFGSFCAKLIDGLGGADFRAVGCDIIFSYLANRFPALQRNMTAAFMVRWHAITTGSSSRGQLHCRLQPR
jgi:hypothetical protein